MDYEIQVGKVRPLELALRDALLDVVREIAAGKMTSAEVYGILGEIQLIVMGSLEYPEDRDNG